MRKEGKQERPDSGFLISCLPHSIRLILAAMPKKVQLACEAMAMRREFILIGGKPMSEEPKFGWDHIGQHFRVE